jgi:hypothetical protein
VAARVKPGYVLLGGSCRGRASISGRVAAIREGTPRPVGVTRQAAGRGRVLSVLAVSRPGRCAFHGRAGALSKVGRLSENGVSAAAERGRGRPSPRRQSTKRRPGSAPPLDHASVGPVGPSEPHRAEVAAVRGEDLKSVDPYPFLMSAWGRTTRPAYVVRRPDEHYGPSCDSEIGESDTLLALGAGPQGGSRKNFRGFRRGRKVFPPLPVCGGPPRLAFSGARAVRARCRRRLSARRAATLSF